MRYFSEMLETVVEVSFAAAGEGEAGGVVYIVTTSERAPPVARYTELVTSAFK